MADVREVIRRINEEVYGASNVALIDDLLHEGFVNHTVMPGLPPDREGEKAFVRAVHAALSDTEATLERVLVDGDQVAWRWRMRGTHTGDFMGTPASGNRVDITGNDIGVMRDGRLTEMWGEVDMLSVMTQLVAIEPPGGAG